MAILKDLALLMYRSSMGGARNLKLGGNVGARARAQGAREIAVSVSE